MTNAVFVLNTGYLEGSNQPWLKQPTMLWMSSVYIYHYCLKTGGPVPQLFFLLSSKKVCRTRIYPALWNGIGEGQYYKCECSISTQLLWYHTRRITFLLWYRYLATLVLFIVSIAVSEEDHRILSCIQGLWKFFSSGIAPRECMPTECKSGSFISVSVLLLAHSLPRFAFWT